MSLCELLLVTRNTYWTFLWLYDQHCIKGDLPSGVYVLVDKLGKPYDSQ